MLNDTHKSSAPHGKPENPAKPTCDLAGRCRLTVEELIEELKDDKRITVGLVDVDGQIRIKNVLVSRVKSGIGMCSGFYDLDIQDGLFSTINRSQEGYIDLVASAATETLVRLPLEDGVPFCLLNLVDVKGAPATTCPRHASKRVFQAYADLDMDPMVGLEYEFVNYVRPEGPMDPKSLVPITSGNCFASSLRPFENKAYVDDIMRTCGQMGISLETFHTELGPGVYEIALEHTHATKLVDQATIFKMLSKQVGIKHGIIPSFMAKPFNGRPGCSGHLHMSVKSRSTGENLFFDPAARATEADPYRMPGMSDTFASFITGILVGLPSILAFLAPTVNSYKRLVENNWAPVYVDWSYRKRTSALRVIMPEIPANVELLSAEELKRLGQSAHVELRVPGADANPYLSVAASFACGLWGIKHNLSRIPIPALGEAGSSSDSIPTTVAVDYPKDSDGKSTLPNVTGRYNPDSPNGTPLSSNLLDAVRDLRAPNSIARQVLGDEFVDYFIQTRLHEWNLYARTVTDWEYQRYLELV
ncbi:hypothetical protein IWQ60_008179 [Tieghemiomyces parasiticus]|uniref:GS catalytic domain-containing protein n=1 Tax=Tieghemiomyces parasiticus TaxID=78921 RepID=A0A9W8DNM3_9FUNG|nr:hypothetical protein IWQ60_008179 [Tieghemiomyces parasiticus]